MHLRPGWHYSGSWRLAACAYSEKTGKRDLAVAGVALVYDGIAVVRMVWRVYPELDRQLSGRAAGSMTCLPPTNRSQRYSIDYYAGRDLPDCK